MGFMGGHVVLISGLKLRKIGSVVKTGQDSKPVAKPLPLGKQINE
jgi:hypothetical protein